MKEKRARITAKPVSSSRNYQIREVLVQTNYTKAQKAAMEFDRLNPQFA